MTQTKMLPSVHEFIQTYQYQSSSSNPLVLWCEAAEAYAELRLKHAEQENATLTQRVKELEEQLAAFRREQQARLSRWRKLGHGV